MKTKNFFSLMINPFTRIAGWQAFGIGMIFLLLMGLVGSINGTWFDGVLDLHTSGEPYAIDIAYRILAIDVLCLVLCMWIAGLIFSKKFRFIDILGTMTLSKAPMLLLALLAFTIDSSLLKSIKENPLAILADPGIILNSPSFIIFSLLSIPFIVWNVALMYNAFKVSCDIKKPRIVPAFIIALLAAEILSKILISLAV